MSLRYLFFLSCHLVIVSLILNNSSIIDREKYLCYIYLFLLTKKEKARNISAFKVGLSEIKLGWNVWPKWFILRLWNQLWKISPWFTINVFYSDQWKRMGLIFVNLGKLNALLNLKERDVSRTFKSFLNTPKSSTGNAYKSYKNKLILFEFLSVYIMKNNFKTFNQILRPRGGY